MVHQWVFVRRVALAFTLIVMSLWYSASHNCHELQGHSVPGQARNTTCTVSGDAYTYLSNETTENVSEASSQPYAYVFYATDANYACSILVNIARLQRFSTPHRIIVLAAPSLPNVWLTAFTSQNATVIPFEPPPNPSIYLPYYHDVLLKLISFKLHHYIPSLRRILVLDADQLIQKPLDHLFDLPAVDVAMPHAYWLGPGAMTSAMMLVYLSDRLWEQMNRELRNVTTDVFDMDLVNSMFSRTALVLPGDYGTLNSHWEVNDLPRWWQGAQPPSQDPMRTVPPFIARPNPDSLNTTRREGIPGDRNQTRQEQMHAESSEFDKRKDLISKILTKVYKEVKVLHFTAVGKPWHWDVESVKVRSPNAHYLLARQFGQWRNEAKEVCPGVWKDIVA